MKPRMIQAHMDAAAVYADLSYCVRSKVGCVIVKDDRIVSIGYNGTPPGEDNTCEDINNVTKPNVIHAEINAINKIASEPHLLQGAALFCTYMPCLPCARKIFEVGVTQVFYRYAYRLVDGVTYLVDNEIDVQQLE